MNNSSSTKKLRVYILFFTIYTVMAIGCTSQTSSLNVVNLTISRSHKICSRAADVKLDKFNSVLDFESGQIFGPDGSKIDFSVGEILDDTDVSSRAGIPKLSRNGIKATKELRTNKSESITLAGFSKGTGGRHKISVRYQFPDGDINAKDLALELAIATVVCDKAAMDTQDLR